MQKAYEIKFNIGDRVFPVDTIEDTANKPVCEGNFEECIGCPHAIHHVLFGLCEPSGGVVKALHCKTYAVDGALIDMIHYSVRMDGSNADREFAEGYLFRSPESAQAFCNTFND